MPRQRHVFQRLPSSGSRSSTGLAGGARNAAQRAVVQALPEIHPEFGLLVGHGQGTRNVAQQVLLEIVIQTAGERQVLEE